MGAPMSAAHFAPLADALASKHTVVTPDPRGIAGSRLDDPEQDSTPELRADDVAALMDAMGAETADVAGSSGGAVTGLALVARHPDRVRIPVAHEPPLLELLPDAVEQRAQTDDIIETFHRESSGAAWMKFTHNAGFDSNAGSDGDDPPRRSRSRSSANPRRRTSPTAAGSSPTNSVARHAICPTPQP